MNDIGLQDLPPDVIATLRRVPSLLIAAHFSMGREGRAYVRIDRAAIEHDELLILSGCPLLARIMAGGCITLIFDPDLSASEDRQRRRAAMLTDLSQVAPEVAEGISREIL